MLRGGALVPTEPRWFQFYAGPAHAKLVAEALRLHVAEVWTGTERVYFRGSRAATVAALRAAGFLNLAGMVERAMGCGAPLRGAR